MPLIDDVRAKTARATTRPRSTLYDAQDAVADAIGEALTRAATVATDADVRERAVAAVGLLQRQVYAVMGLADAVLGTAEAVVETLAKRAEALPVEAQGTAGKLGDAARTRVAAAAGTAETLSTTVQSVGSAARRRAAFAAYDLRGRGAAAASSIQSVNLADAAEEVRSVLTSQLGHLRSSYDELADRGERMTRQVRSNPRVLRVFGPPGTLAEAAADEIAPVARKAHEPAAAPRKKVATKTGSARKATATAAPGKAATAPTAAKTTAAKATAAKAATATTTTAKAATARTARTARPAKESGKATSTGTANAARSTAAGAGGAKPSATGRRAPTSRRSSSGSPPR